jgi:hypothetical protein
LTDLAPNVKIFRSIPRRRVRSSGRDFLIIDCNPFQAVRMPHEVTLDLSFDVFPDESPAFADLRSQTYAQSLVRECTY